MGDAKEKYYHLVWTAGHGDPMREVCVPHLAQENSKGETRGRSRQEYKIKEHGH